MSLCICAARAGKRRLALKYYSSRDAYESDATISFSICLYSAGFSVPYSSSEAVFQFVCSVARTLYEVPGLGVPGKRDLCSACPSPWATTSPSTRTCARYLHTTPGSVPAPTRSVRMLMCQQPEVAHRIPSGTGTRWKEKTAYGKKRKHCAAGWRGVGQLQSAEQEKSIRQVPCCSLNRTGPGPDSVSPLNSPRASSSQGFRGVEGPVYSAGGPPVSALPAPSCLSVAERLLTAAGLLE